MNFEGFDFFENDENLKQRIESLYSQNRQPHAIVIEGAVEQRCEKLATFLTMRAVCCAENKPCGKCEQCIKAREQAHPDIYYAQPEKNRRFILLSKCEVLLKMQVSAPMRPILRYLCFAVQKKIDTCCAKLILKLLEEPPQNCLFLLLCQNSRGLLNTVLSRCTVIKIKGEPNFYEDSLDLAVEVAEGTIAPSEWQLLAALSQFSDRKRRTKHLRFLPRFSEIV